MKADAAITTPAVPTQRKDQEFLKQLTRRYKLDSETFPSLDSFLKAAALLGKEISTLKFFL